MRKIIHIDMDAFFAAVEQRDFPELKGRPVIVGGRPDSRGVVATCSYEARRFGIHSAMASSRAYKLCPQAVFIRPRFEAYRQASEQVREVFAEYTEMIEPLSIDEAFLDVTGVDFCEGSATRMAEEIRKKIFERTQLTASAGISYNKFLAKLASDQNKPDGQFVIRPGEAEHFLHDLPIGRFYGIGKVTESRLQSLGINTGADLQNKSMQELEALFGHSAEYYYDIARGIDDRPVTTSRVRKSLGSENTFQEDLDDPGEILQCLLQIATELLEEMQHRELLAYTFTIKIKYADFTQVTRSYTGGSVVSTPEKILALVPQLLSRTEAGERPVRLLGASFSSLVAEEEHRLWGQMELF